MSLPFRIVKRVADDLAAQGIFTYSSFQSVAATEPQWLVEGLIADPSVNLLVGDSCLGKTPFGVTLGICVASGTAFLGRKVRRGRVLYCDAESGKPDFNRLIGSISTTLGLAQPPEGFMFWSPNWASAPFDGSMAEAVLAHVDKQQPDLVIVDPLRNFWPAADQKSEVTIAMIGSMRACKATWVINHHRRKAVRGIEAARLADDPHGWFQDAAGSHALVNHTDSRLGVEKTSQGDAELLLGGFIRSVGPLSPIELGRIYDDAGQAQGYRLVGGEASLTDSDRRVWRDLPMTFRFGDVDRLLGGSSGSNAKRLIDLLISKRLSRRASGGRKMYVKLSGAGGETVN